MNYKMMGKFISQIIAIEAVFLLPALGISLYGGENTAVYGFLMALTIMLVVSCILYLFCRKASRLFGPREGMVCVGFSWIALSLLGALPFYFSGCYKTYVDAFFEIVSGFTTTGASVYADVESLPRGILYWRSFSNWLGGMGVLVFLLALSGSQGSGFTLHLLRAESPGPDVGKLVPKMKQTAKILYILYIGMTALNVIFLLLGGLSLYDALCTAFSTAGTGGFSIWNDSMASCSPYIQDVTTVFMFLFGINFSCYYLLLLRQFKNVFRDEELRLYIGLALAATALIVWNTYAASFNGDVLYSIRHAAFQVSSLMTTTGFSTVNFDLWHPFSKGILLILMVVGACAGSTGGGFKCARVLLVFKNLRRNIRQVLNPKKVMVIRNNGNVVSERIVSNTGAYLGAYIIIIVICTLLISLDGYNLETNLSATLACINNIGPGFSQVGPYCNFALYSPFSKILLSIAMLAGRLEIFPILILLSRSTWRKN